MPTCPHCRASLSVHLEVSGLPIPPPPDARPHHVTIVRDPHLEKEFCCITDSLGRGRHDYNCPRVGNPNEHPQCTCPGRLVGHRWDCPLYVHFP